MDDDGTEHLINEITPEMNSYVNLGELNTQWPELDAEDKYPTVQVYDAHEGKAIASDETYEDIDPDTGGVKTYLIVTTRRKRRLLSNVLMPTTVWSMCAMSTCKA